HVPLLTCSFYQTSRNTGARPANPQFAGFRSPGVGDATPLHRRIPLASERKSPMLTTSVAVVRKMLDAVAGSAPNLRKASGTKAPNKPLTVQEPIMARKTMIESHSAEGFS